MKPATVMLGSGQRKAKARSTVAGSGPKTKLPFLVNTVKKYASCANKEFQPYPVLLPGMSRQASSSLLYKDEHCILVNDVFPKSFVHCLVMPLEQSLLSLNDLKETDLELVMHLKQIAERYVEFIRKDSPQTFGGRRFITGFHALPSLPMLHLHLLSLDLDSPCLKTKKHYNSFATYFFLSTDRIIEDLRTNGHVTLNKDVGALHRLEDQPMQCLWCGEPLVNIPTMKKHVKECPKNESLMGAESEKQRKGKETP